MPKWNKCKVSAIFKTGASFVQSLKGTGLHFFIFRNVENLCFDGRQKVKKMLKEWDEEFPGRSSSIFKALQHVEPTHLLDSNLFDFNAIHL